MALDVKFLQVYFVAQLLATNTELSDDYPARALRALGLLLADGTPTVGGGKTF